MELKKVNLLLSSGLCGVRILVQMHSNLQCSRAVERPNIKKMRNVWVKLWGKDMPDGRLTE
jgi:hypothetical protein